MHKQLTAFIGAAVGLAVLAASAGPAAARHSYRWYASPCCIAVYGPPIVYVVPPAYAYYPRPLYSVGCCGTIHGPRGSYYTPYYSRYGYRGYFAHRRRR